jgi:hypothetical protein
MTAAEMTAADILEAMLEVEGVSDRMVDAVVDAKPAIVIAATMNIALIGAKGLGVDRETFLKIVAAMWDIDELTMLDEKKSQKH